MVTVAVNAGIFAGDDDCLVAAAAWYINQLPELEGWDLDPRWASEDRDEILLTVPDWAV
jgi:hypothetical protein